MADLKASLWAFHFAFLFPYIGFSYGATGFFFPVGSFGLYLYPPLAPPNPSSSGFSSPSLCAFESKAFLFYTNTFLQTF
jgi:hypothetical protein